jgi:hypothetical protein
VTAPEGTTHFAEFYGEVQFYKLTHGLHYNTVIDHPVECWQKTDIWKVFENGKWVCPGAGWSSRRLQRYTSSVSSSANCDTIAT